MEDDLVTVVDAEGDHIAVAQRVLLHLRAIHKQAVAVAAVHQAVAGALGHDRRAAAGDAAVVKLQNIVDLTAAPDVEGLNRQGDRLSRAVRGDDFEYGFGLRGTFVHGVRRGQIVTCSIDKT